MPLSETDIAVKFAEYDNKIETLTDKISNLENTITELKELVITVKLLAQEQKNMNESLKAQNTKIDKLSGDVNGIVMQPAENWNKIKTTIVTGVISAIVSAAMGVLITLVASGVIGG